MVIIYYHKFLFSTKTSKYETDDSDYVASFSSSLLGHTETVQDSK